jgi:hypothetical protein
MRKTGWDPPALMQDDHRGLSQWFATRPDARYVFKRNQRRNEMKQTKQMTLDDLLEEVEHLSSKLRVYVWVDGERYPINYVDKSFIREGFVELNASVDPPFLPSPEEYAFVSSYCRNVAQATDTEVFFFLDHRLNESVNKDSYHWWSGVEDAWLMWQDAKKFTQGESK